uniref:F-box domain-containing protein n=1 Tax=Syphacia muris TaxID=451379 RepID=A0A0N5AG54_9BILA
MKYRIFRNNFATAETKVFLPDEVIEHIVSFISPIELCLSGWERVSIGFSQMMQSVVSRHTSLDTIFGSDSYFFSKLDNVTPSDQKALFLQLLVIAKKLFPHITSLTTSSSMLYAFFQLRPFVEDRLILFPKLRCLNLFLGPGFDRISQHCALLCIYQLARLFACEIRRINMTVRLMEGQEHLLSVTTFRELLKVILTFASKSVSWSLCLRDSTERSQSWFCPSELTHYRNVAFISYVRVFIEHDIHLDELLLIDELKVSPYMMIMKHSHRFLFMYNEFKACDKLCIQYDVGNIVRTVNGCADMYPHLRSVEVVASHVLYKNEFLAYLSDASSLALLEIDLPPHWIERVKRCSFGCFRNADFGCFTESGWSSFSKILPQARLVVKT